MSSLSSLALSSAFLPSLLLGSAAPVQPDLHPDAAQVWVADVPAGTKLVLNDSGDFGAHDGCNTGSGTWEQEGENYTFSEGMFTLRGCAGMDPWLSQARSATVTGDILLLHDAEGTRVGSMTRA